MILVPMRYLLNCLPDSMILIGIRMLYSLINCASLSSRALPCSALYSILFSNKLLVLLGTPELVLIADLRLRIEVRRFGVQVYVGALLGVFTLPSCLGDRGRAKHGAVSTIFDSGLLKIGFCMVTKLLLRLSKASVFLGFLISPSFFKNP